MSILVAVVIFVIGSSIQAGAVSVAMIFVGMLLKTGQPLDHLLTSRHRKKHRWIFGGHAHHDCSDVYGRSLRARHPWYARRATAV
jgi:hypothetical protein